MLKKTKYDGDIAHENKAPSGTEHKENPVNQDPKEDLEERLKEKEKEAADNYDKYVRVMAELDNFRKRTAKEKTDLLKYGNENLLRDILPVVDNLDRALKHAEDSCDFDAFKKGLELLRTQLVGSLEKHGLEPIDCSKVCFDPNYHEAMLQVSSETHEDNEVVDELEKGYKLHGRLLRPAKVSVCKKNKTKDCV
ncbi:MAG: Protein GrpE [Syntrophus sp. SKADARSKE-3]|nr:Protein GrpE [Syntrophus sp. SKADARSKE-3]